MDKKPETENDKVIMNNELNQLTHIFPFLLSQKNNSNTEEITQTNEEFQSMVKDIVKTETNTQTNEYLKGEENIIENMIIKYGNITKKDISNLENLTVQLPKNFGMLNDFGFYLPKLKKLNLSKSKIKSIDEIGTSFTNLETLNVSQCELEDLSGIVCFINLIELDASHNKIDDLVVIGGCAGNLSAVANLIKGMDANEVINKLEYITCGKKNTSCPNEIANILKVFI